MLICDNSRLGLLHESDQQTYFQEYLIKDENFSDQYLLIIYKINHNRLGFLAFNHYNSSFKNLSLFTIETTCN